MKVFVGNLSFNTSDNDLRDTFAAYGEVISAQVITDRETMRSRGFAFVEMADDAAAAAISGLNGTDLQGRALTVNEAKPREDRAPRGGGSNRW
ncbi:MAG: RNA-binding protein [Chloroflexi bacterium]|jgi:RNA recognition motif-containing protein|nr:RNA-binding protein [Chloroflexota bacterium]